MARPPRHGETWNDPQRAADVARARVVGQGYSSGQADDKPPMGLIVAIGGIAVASALLLGKLGAR